jgi:hypothetical protein
MLPSLSNLSMKTLPIEVKRKKPPAEADPAAAGGQTDADFQRMQSYYVCAQQQNPVLFVVQGWFVGENRVAFDAMQRSAMLNLELKTNDFYPLCSENKVQFETTLLWYQLYMDKMNAFLQNRQVASLMPVPAQMITEMRNKAKVPEQVFVANLEAELNAMFPIEKEKTPKLTTMYKYRVPAQQDSMVFFTGPHMVDSSPVRRLVCYVHSLSENTASEILSDYPTYTSQVESMLVPPNAQGKSRSSLVDAFLREHFGGQWGWAREPGVLFDQASIDQAPRVAPRNPALVNSIRESFINNSCYVVTDVLANSDAGFSASDFENFILNCLAIVIDKGLQKQEVLKRSLLTWIGTFPDGVDALLAHPADPTTHEKTLKNRLKMGDTALMTEEVKDYAMSTLLRSTRKPTSASWERFDGTSQFAWPTEAVPEGKKVIRDESELEELLRPADTELMQTSVADGPLARLNGDMNNPKDLWQLAYNIGGLLPAAKLRRRLFLAKQITHPHIGHWVSPLKPWNPPLTNPVGNWQNVYMLLTKGMFDSHYMPQHNQLRAALKPIIEQVWHASSRKSFEKVIFAPERFNIRELPEGGQELQWHIDQDAIAPACPVQTPGAGSSSDNVPQEQQQSQLMQPGFLQDA